MFKRVRWMGMGAAAGVGASLWAQYRLRRTMDEHPGVKLSAQAASQVRRWGLQARDAVVEGRAAMLEREALLEAERDGRLVPLRGEGRTTRGVPTRLRIGDARRATVDGTDPGIDRAADPMLAHPSLGTNDDRGRRRRGAKPGS